MLMGRVDDRGIEEFPVVAENRDQHVRTELVRWSASGRPRNVDAARKIGGNDGLSLHSDGNPRPHGVSGGHDRRFEKGVTGDEARSFAEKEMVVATEANVRALRHRAAIQVGQLEQRCWQET